MAWSDIKCTGNVWEKSSFYFRARVWRLTATFVRSSDLRVNEKMYGGEKQCTPVVNLSPNFKRRHNICSATTSALNEDVWKQ